LHTTLTSVVLLPSDTATGPPCAIHPTCDARYMAIPNVSGAPGSVGSGASHPLFFAHMQHDVENPLSPPLAIARYGGVGGPLYVYSSEDSGLPGSYESSSTFAGGGRRWF
jgi:hypothetical protein